MGKRMKREIFCMDCGLFYVGDQYVTDGNGRINYNAGIWQCPNEGCPSYTNDEPAGRMSTDSTGYAYFSDANGELIRKFGWSSEKYATPEAIEHYRRCGITIR